MHEWKGLLKCYIMEEQKFDIHSKKIVEIEFWLAFWFVLKCFIEEKLHCFVNINITVACNFDTWMEKYPQALKSENWFSLKKSLKLSFDLLYFSFSSSHSSLNSDRGYNTSLLVATIRLLLLSLNSCSLQSINIYLHLVCFHFHITIAES